MPPSMRDDVSELAKHWEYDFRLPGHIPGQYIKPQNQLQTLETMTQVLPTLLDALG